MFKPNLERATYRGIQARNWVALFVYQSYFWFWIFFLLFMSMKEKRAFLFCQQDRAILCRDCDFPIHKANEHTQNHNRFLLTGVKLSATATVYSSATASNSVPDVKSQKGAQISIQKPVSVKPVIIHNSPSATAALKTTAAGTNISSISEYLIETIPGWRVEDLLDSPPPSSFGFSEVCNTLHPTFPFFLFLFFFFLP